MLASSQNNRSGSYPCVSRVGGNLMADFGGVDSAVDASEVMSFSGEHFANLEANGVIGLNIYC